jgi:hypothetical protein
MPVSVDKACWMAIAQTQSCTQSANAWYQVVPSTTAIDSTVWASVTSNWMQGVMFIPSVSGTLYYHNIPLTVVVWPRNEATYAQYVAAPQPRPLARPALVRGRRAFVRSVELFRKFRPEAEIRTFLSGKPLLIHGHRFDYRVKKTGRLLRLTMHPDSPHIPYDFHILSKAGKVLAKGCIVVPGTPVIDQLLALILHVQDREEESVVINTTNWTPGLSGVMPLAA